jgi:hypothetical protein
MSAGSFSWMKQLKDSLGKEQQHLVHGGVVADPGVVALGQLLHAQPHVAQELIAVRVALGIGARVEIAEV